MNAFSQAKPPKNWKRIALLIAGTFSWLIGALLLLWLTAPSWVLPVLQHANTDKKWWDTLDFGVSHLDAQNLEIEHLRFQKNNIDIYSEGLSITYKPSELLKKRVDIVLVKPLRINLDIEPFFGSTTETKTDLEAKEKESRTSFDWVAALKTNWSQLPYQQLIASDVEINLQTKNQPPFHIEAMLLSDANEEEIRAQTNVRFFEESINLDTHLSLKNPSDRQLNLSLHLWNPMDLIQRIQPLLPPEISKAIDAQNFEIGALYASLDWLSLNEMLSTQLALSQLSYDKKIEMEGVTLEAESSEDLSQIKGQVELASLKFPDYGSTSLHGEFEIQNPTSPHLSFQSTWRSSELLSEPDVKDFESVLLEPLTITADYSGNTLEIETSEVSSSLFPAILNAPSLSLTLPEKDEGITYSFSTDITPKLSDWSIAPTSANGSISLILNGNATPIIKGIESFRTNASLILSEQAISGRLGSATANAETSIFGKIKGEANTVVNGSTVQVQTQLFVAELKAFQSQNFRIEADSELTLSTTFDSKAEWSSVEAATRNLEQTALNLKLSGKGAFAATPFSVRGLKLETFPWTQAKAASSGFPFELTAELVKLDVWRLLKPSGSGILNENNLHVQLSGNLNQPDLNVGANYEFDWGTMEQEGTIRLQNREPQARTTLALHEIFPDIATAIVSGVIAAQMEITSEKETLKLPLTASIRDAQLTMPDSGFLVEGIQLPDIGFSDLITGTTVEPLHLKISKIDFAPYVLSNLEFKCSITPNYTLRVEHLSFEFCQGRFDITFSKPITAPYDDISCRVEFKAVDIKQLTDLIPDFKENLTGKMDGFLPFTFTKGKISWGRGKANLSPGTTARLRYAENGLFASYIPEIVISKELDIDINNALRDITITDMTLDIQPSAKFDQPSILVISGHSNNTEIEIPIERIQLNIRAGDVPGLINRSLKSQEWMQKLIFNQ